MTMSVSHNTWMYVTTAPRVDGMVLACTQPPLLLSTHCRHTRVHLVPTTTLHVLFSCPGNSRLRYVHKDGRQQYHELVVFPATSLHKHTVSEHAMAWHGMSCSNADSTLVPFIL